ncbi:TIGR02757 family protein [Nautilia sp.]
MNIKEKLDTLIKTGIYEVNENRPDPVIIARKFKDEYIAMIAALFAYGNVKAILKFLNSVNYERLTDNGGLYYRFQSCEDVREFFKTVTLMREKHSLNELFLKGYEKSHNPVEGLKEIIKTIYDTNPYRSKGYEFLIGKIPPEKTKGTSPYKRWNMFLRWMVRDEFPDLGMWKGVNKKDLIIPLDTHTHKVSLKLGLLKRKTYDLQAALELSAKLKEFDPEDPLKYDFALYRIGQMNIKFS